MTELGKAVTMRNRQMRRLEKPTRQIDEGVWLCDKCYRNFVKEIRFKRKGKVIL